MADGKGSPLKGGYCPFVVVMVAMFGPTVRVPPLASAGSPYPMTCAGAPPLGPEPEVTAYRGKVEYEKSSGANICSPSGKMNLTLTGPGVVLGGDVKVSCSPGGRLTDPRVWPNQTSGVRSGNV